MKYVIIILLAFISACETIPTKADCGAIRCMPEEHSPMYWRLSR